MILVFELKVIPHFPTAVALVTDPRVPAGEAGSFAPWLSFRQVAADITITDYSLSGEQLTLNWTGGSGPYRVQGKPSVGDDWEGDRHRGHHRDRPRHRDCWVLPCGGAMT